MVIECNSNGMCLCKCPRCGNTFEHGPILMDETFRETFLSIAGNALCDDCVADKMAAEEKRKIEERRIVLAETLYDRMEKANMPRRFIGMDKPFVREAATWLWQHRHGSLLLAGGTGTGKTSSAVIVAKTIMGQRFVNVSYQTRQSLLAKYVKAKTSDSDSEEDFYRRIGDLDILIIDEMIGKKGNGKMSPAAQEMFFTLVDKVYSGDIRTKVWFLGNFFHGAVDSLVDDPEPLKRRLKDCFALGWVEGGKVEEITM